MATFNWNIVQMDRLTSDNFVVTVHYSVTATEGDYSANTYGTVGYTQESDNFIPFDNLTPEIVTGWVQTSLGKDTVEESLTAQIEAQKNPVQVSGLPWATESTAE
jgi:hypothetical protein